jgi:uncharacterized membrane protein
MKDLIKITIIVLILDHIWISNYMGKLFSKLVKKMTNKKMKVNLKAAVLAYICMVLGLRYLGLPNIKENNIANDSLFYGTLLGLLSFGVFDFTNKAVFSDYSWDVVYVDIAWGIFLNIATLYLTKKIDR